MSEQKPEAVHGAFVKAFNEANLDALVALYEPDATMVAQPGTAVSGRDAIGRVLEQFLALKGRIEMRTEEVATAGDLALLHARWSLVGTGADGKTLTLGGRTAEVARRQPDGSWRYTIDNPYGAS